MTNRWLSLALLSAVALVVGTLSPVQTARAEVSGSATRVAMSTSAAKPPKTQVRLRVKGCAGCWISPVQAVRPDRNGNDNVWSAPEQKVRMGSVTFRVPTIRTKGLHFVIDDPGTVNRGAQRLVVSRYVGRRPGERVTARAAAKGKRAFHCIAGTRASRLMLRLKVDRYPSRDAYTRKRGYDIRPYFSPGTRTLGSAHDTYAGTLGAQDVAYCRI